MEALLNKQKEIGDQIFQLNNNYKKDGENRKTKSYFEKKISSLKTTYNEFVNNDDAIRKYIPNLETSHEYFQNRKEIQDIYNSFIGDMRQRLNNAPTTPTIQDNTIQGLQVPTFTFPASGSNVTLTKQQTMSLTTNFLQMLKQQNIRIRSLYKEIRSAEDTLENNKSRPALNLKLKNMERMMMQIMDLHEKICMEASEDDENNSKYFVELHYENINNDYDQIVIKITTEIEENENCKVKPMEIRLPAIEIPHFHGDYMKWTGFSDTFKRLVHENHQLTNTHRMNYLKSHVGGSAGKL